MIISALTFLESKLKQGQCCNAGIINAGKIADATLVDMRTFAWVTSILHPFQRVYKILQMFWPMRVLRGWG
jgi:hypothetical protein